ncbi:hypothetical protein H632_c3289p0, partial [Helicosporidium sp. ATCC 50920]
GGEAWEAGKATLNADGAECAICMDAEEDVRCLPCLHPVCFVCALRLSAKVGGPPKCPFCREDIRGFAPLPGARGGGADAALETVDEQAMGVAA